MQVSPQQVYQEVLNQGGSTTQAQVAAALVDGIESNGDPTELAGGVGPAQGLFQFEPGTWTGSAGGGKGGLPATVGAATWQQQVTGFLNASRGNNFGAWGPDLSANPGDPNSSSNPNYGYSGAPQAGSAVANKIASLNLSGSAQPPLDAATAAAYNSDPSVKAYLDAQAANAAATGSTGGAAGTTAPTPNSSVVIGGQTYTGTQGNVSALSTIETTLGAYGFQGSDLTALTNWAWGEITSNTDPSQVAIDIQTPGSVAYPIFEKQFPGFTAANEQLLGQGLQAVSVANYQQYQTMATQLAQAAGLPPGFINKENVGILIGNNVSQTELTARVNDATTLALNSTPQEQGAFNAYFGTGYATQMNANDPMAFGQQGTGNFTPTGGHGPLTVGQIAAIALDPESAEPLIKQQITAAQIGGAFEGAGLGQANNGGIDAATALRLSQAGISQAQGQSAAASLGVYAPLLNARPGAGGEAAQQVVTADQLATGNLLGDTSALRQQQVAIETAKSPFAGGGGFISSSKGAVGTGSASPTGSGQ